MAYNSDYFELQGNWKLTLPVDSSGGNTGEAYETTILKGFESPYFYDSPEGAMVFVAHVDGATTSGTKYARSELRELNNGKSAAWKLTEGGTMTATLRIDEIPTGSGTNRIMVGQIHGKSDELIRLYWEKGAVYFVNDKAVSTGRETKYTFASADGGAPSVSIGEKFSYKIDARGDTLNVVIYADGKEYSSVTKINPVWQTDTFYFKAGVYLGVNESSAVGQAKVSFFGLDFGHTPGSGLDGLSPSTPTTPTDPEPTPEPQPEPQPQPVVNLVGTSNADYLQGDAANNTIDGGSGADVINGGDGADQIIGNDGNDTVTGGAGKDTFIVFRGDGGLVINDFVPTLSGDVLHVKGYNASEMASATFVQSGANVVLTLSDRTTVTFANSQLADILKANLKADINNVVTSFNPVQPEPETPPVTEQPTDPVVIPPVVVVPPVVEVRPEPTKAGTSNSDTLKGNDSIGDIIAGRDGNDTIIGYDGDDKLYGDNGNDKLYGNDDNDLVYGDAGTDTLYGGIGNDKLYGGADADILFGDYGDDVLNGGAGQDQLTGGKGKDTFVFDQLPDIHDIIKDFNILEDKLDLDALLGANGIASMGTHGGKSAVFVDTDGAGSAQAVVVATFDTTVNPANIDNILA